MKQKLPEEPEAMMTLLSLLLPVSETVWVGVSGSLEDIARVALFDPPELGENTTRTEQFWEGASVVPVQRSFWVVKLTAWAPLIAI